MRKIVCLVMVFSFLQFSYAGISYPTAAFFQNEVAVMIVQPLVNIVPSTDAQKKIPLKERLLQKWYKKKMNHTFSEEKQKKTVRLLGLVSVLASLLGPFTVLLAFVSASPGLFVVGGIIFCLAAVILGIVTLKKRKKLTDKTGTSKVPSVIAIIIGGLFIIGLISLYSSVNL